jgi:NADPH:quinone reductase-like Zn-dependent oxidoreductase
MKTMKAVRVHHFGGPDMLEMDRLAVPKPANDEVLVRVRAASVNPVDYKTREGEFPVIPADKLPVTLGRDVCGTVVACGAAAGNAKPGDSVYALIGNDRGTHAEYVLLKANEYAAKPEHVDETVAAAVPLAALTAWQGLFDHGKLKAGERVLIHGGAGGVGHFAVQFAKGKGAEVITTVSSKDMEFARSLGADRVIDHNAHPFEELVRDVDLVLDLIDGDTRERSWQTLKPDSGRLITSLSEPSQQVAAEHRVRAARYMTQPNARQLGEIAGLIDAGEIWVEVERVFSIEQARGAQLHLEQDHVRGKVVLKAEE